MFCVSFGCFLSFCMCFVSLWPLYIYISLSVGILRIFVVVFVSPFASRFVSLCSRLIDSPTRHINRHFNHRLCFCLVGLFSNPSMVIKGKIMDLIILQLFVFWWGYKSSMISRVWQGQSHKQSGKNLNQLDFIVVAQLVNFFLRWYIRKFASSAAFGIYIVVYFIQTLGAMFAASITAKTGRFFIINVLYNSNVFVQKNWLLLPCKRAVADHELGLKISIEYVNVNIKWPDSAATTKNSHLIHQSSIPWPFNVKALLLQPYPVYSYTN